MTRLEVDLEQKLLCIDGVVIDGFVEETRCERCGHWLCYYGEFDAVMCLECNTWEGSGDCSDPECQFCPKPSTPLPLLRGVITELPANFTQVV